MQQRNSKNETNNCNKGTHQKQTTEALNKQMPQASKQTNATTQYNNYHMTERTHVPRYSSWTWIRPSL